MVVVPFPARSNEGRPFSSIYLPSDGEIGCEKWLVQARLGAAFLCNWCGKATFIVCGDLWHRARTADC